MAASPPPNDAPQSMVSARPEVSEALLARHLNDVETHIKRLPPLSTSIHEILAQLRDVDTDMRWLELHISSDPSLATRLLKMANSAFYCPRAEIYTVPRALMTLGFRTSLNVILAASMRSAFTTSVAIPGFQPRGLMRHCVAVGTCAAALGRAIPSLQPVADKLFVAGLLHDIGRVALAPLYGQYQEELRARCGTQPPTPEIESNLFGIDHAEAGAMVVQQWKLPAPLAEPITHHHDPIATLAGHPLVLGVRAADLFVLGKGYAMIQPCEVRIELDAVLEALATDMEQVCGALGTFEAVSASFLESVA